MSLMWLEATTDKTLLIGELSKTYKSTYFLVLIIILSIIIPIGLDIWT